MQGTGRRVGRGIKRGQGALLDECGRRDREEIKNLCRETVYKVGNFFFKYDTGKIRKWNNERMNIMIKLLGKDGREEKRVELERKEERRSRGNEIEWEL